MHYMAPGHSPSLNGLVSCSTALPPLPLPSPSLPLLPTPLPPPRVRPGLPLAVPQGPRRRLLAARPSQLPALAGPRGGRAARGGGDMDPGREAGDEGAGGRRGQQQQQQQQRGVAAATALAANG